ncbi:MAG: POTRA domain-containing protein [Cyanobacteria bacterium J06648_1]
MRRFKLWGIRSCVPQQINKIIQPLSGKTVTLAELKSAIDDITQVYLERGYITSRALLVEESLTTGQIQVQIIEGVVSQVNITGTERLETYVLNRLEPALQTPLSSAKLEDQLRLLRLDPLFDNVEASLSAGDNPEVGKSILKVRVTEADRSNARIGIDNYSPPSFGAERLGFEQLSQFDSARRSFRPALFSPTPRLGRHF